MGSSFSILHNYDQPLYSPDLQLISTALQMKTEKLNNNRQKLQSLRDQFGALDVMKGQDQEYLENRLQQVTDLTNQYAGGDLSDDGLARSLQANLSQVIDDNVKNAVLSTKLRRSELAEWSKMEKEKPELYADQNYKWASQGAQQWLNDEQVGTVYKGGGGFIAYDNYQERLTKELPKIAEDLRAEWVVVEGSPYGMFVDKVTKEEVPRDKVEMAVQSLIGQKGMQQIQIDAWDKYDDMPPEQLKAVFDSKYTPIVEDLESDISELEKLAAAETNVAKKERYTSELDSLKKVHQSYKNNSFDALARTRGKEAVYTSLFAQEVQQPWVDMYSYAPRDIKREIDQNSLETIKFNEAHMKWEAEYALKERDLALKIQKQEFEMSKTTQAKQAQDTPIIGDLKEINPEDEKPSHIKAMRKEESAAFSDLQSLSGEDVSVRNGIITQLKGDWRGKENITVKDSDGNDVIIKVKGNEDKLGKIERTLVQKPAFKEEYKASVKDMTNKIYYDLQKNVEAGGSVNGLTNFGLRFNEKGQLEQTEENTDMMQYLLKKKAELVKQGKKLPAHEEKTLKLITNLHYVGDPNADEDLRYQALVNLREDVVKSGASIKYLPKTVKRAEDITQLGKNYQPLPGVYLATEAIRSLGTPAQNATVKDINLSGLGAWDRARGSGGYGDYIGKLENNVKNAMDNNLDKVSMEMSQKTAIFTKERNGTKFTELKNIIGAPKDVESITISRVLDENNNPTNQVDYTYKTGTGGKAVTVSTIGDINTADSEQQRISAETLRGINIDFNTSARPSYDASFGTYAPKISLGKFDVKDATMMIDDMQKAVNYAEATSENAVAKVTSFYNNLLSDRSPYNFKIEAIEETGTFHTVMYDQAGNRLSSSDMMVSKLEDSRVDRMTKEEKAQLRYDAAAKYAQEIVDIETVTRFGEQKNTQLNQLLGR